MGMSVIVAMRVVMRVTMPMVVTMCVTMTMIMPVRMIPVGADAAHMQMVPGLQRADIGLVADDLGPVFADHAVHSRKAATTLGCVLR